MISFIPMEGNAALIKLLESTFAGRGPGASPPKPVEAVAALTFVPFSETNLAGHPFQMWAVTMTDEYCFASKKKSLQRPTDWKRIGHSHCRDM